MREVDTLKKLHFGDIIITEKAESKMYCCSVFLGVLEKDLIYLRGRIADNIQNMDFYNKGQFQDNELQDVADRYMTYICLHLFTMEMYEEKEFMLKQCLFLLQNIIDRGLRFNNSDMLVHYTDDKCIVIDKDDIKGIPDMNMLLVKEKMLGTDIIADNIIQPLEAMESFLTELKKAIQNLSDLLLANEVYDLYKNRGKVLENTSGLVFKKESSYTTGVISKTFHAYLIQHSFLNKKKVKVYSLNTSAFEPKHFYVQNEVNEVNCLKELLNMLSDNLISVRMYFDKPKTYYITDDYFKDMFTLDLDRLEELETENECN